MKGCAACEGRLEKRPAMPVEEIEREYREQMTEEVKQLQKEWLESRPPVVRAMAEKFQHPIYRVKEGAPYNYTPPGTIVTLIKVTEKFDKQTGQSVAAEAWFRVIRNPDGYNDLLTPFDEEWLEPITIEQLKEQVRKEEAN